MRPAAVRAAVALLALSILPLAGCRFTTRRLPVPRAPAVTQTVTPEQLVARLNTRWKALNSLVATVTIQASVMKTQQGVAKDYTTFPGIILMSKPEQLRVYGRVPVIGTRMFDMASDGKNFTLYVPSRDLAYEGPNALTKKSTNTVENMRPGFFLDAMTVRGLSTEDFFQVTAETHTAEDASKKHLLLVPEYILSVSRRRPESQQLLPLRVVHFHRDDLLPYEQDLYDDQGNLETEVSYGRYAMYGDNQYPSTVTIKRPLEEFQVILHVEKVTENMNLTADQFQIKLPPDTKIQQLQ